MDTLISEIDVDNIDMEQIKKQAEILKAGKTVIFPTETVYGVGANGLDKNAIKKIYEAKQRPLNKPISLLVSNIDMIENVAKDITNIEYSIIEKFFPGPLTIILKKKETIPDILTAGSDTIGIRMPANDIALNLINYAGVPLATPSANLSGKPSGTNLKDIIKDFDGNVDCFIDDGPSKIGLASTIVKVIDGVPHILRQGSISIDEINSVIN